MTASFLMAVFLLQVYVYIGDISCQWSQHQRPMSQNYQQRADTPWSWGYVDESTAVTQPPPPRRTQPPPRPTVVRPNKNKPVTPPPPSRRQHPPRTKFVSPVTNKPVRTASTPVQRIVSTTEANHPCAPFPRIVPDFRAPNRRVSQVKCYEYIWGMKYRNEKATRLRECQRLKDLKEGFVRYSAIGGIDAHSGEFPHMGAIGWKAAKGTWVFKCGGSLISDKFVLTAAHCTSVSPRDDTVADIKPKIVRLGDANILANPSGTPTIDAKILRSIVHPQYESPKKYNDIALFELEKPIKEFTFFIQAACLWGIEDTSRLGNQATLTGWGVIDVVKQTTSPVLQAALVDVIEQKQCDKLMRPGCNRNWCGLRNQICAGKLKGGVDSCQGDSGGPLQVKIRLTEIFDRIHYVIGVTSFGIGCARANSPGIYTRVSSYIDWIESVVWP